MALMVVIIVTFVAGGFLLLLTGSGKKKSHSWLQFYAKGKDAGFNIKDIEILYGLAVKSDIEDISSIYWSLEQLDICIRALVKDIHQGGKENDVDSQDLLSNLYDYRNKIEMNKPQAKQGIFNSRQISDGQNLRILIKGTGVFKSEVIKNSQQYLTVSRPIANRESGTFSWTGQVVSVYFWREDDAGYVFDTNIMDEIMSRSIPALKIAHSNSLFRTQKRKSVRVKMNKAAYLYLLTDEDFANSIEIIPGLKCLLEDLSDSGCAIAVGGKGVQDLRIKVQFALNNFPVVMTGTIRSVAYKEEANRSLLRIEADPLPIETRNHILGEVFGMLPEDEEDLPFRILNEEAEAMALAEVEGRPLSTTTESDFMLEE